MFLLISQGELSISWLLNFTHKLGSCENITCHSLRVHHLHRRITLKSENINRGVRFGGRFYLQNLISMQRSTVTDSNECNCELESTKPFFHQKWFHSDTLLCLPCIVIPPVLPKMREMRHR